MPKTDAADRRLLLQDKAAWSHLHTRLVRMTFYERLWQLPRKNCTIIAETLSAGAAVLLRFEPVSIIWNCQVE